jgi:septal ring factor EnvC (AmiA/AmiB activator)
MTRESGRAAPDDEATAAAAELPAAVPTLDLSRLDAIQRWARYGAIAATLLCVAAFAFFSFRLYQIIGELNSKRAELESANRDLGKAQGALKDTNAEIGRKRQEADALQRQIEFYRSTLRTCGVDPQQAVEATATKAAARAGGWSQIPARIYIQIGDEAQRPRADALARLLQAKGFIVPDIENVGADRIPRRSQLKRYAQVWSQDDVDNILALFQSQGVNLNLGEPLAAGGVRPRHYEIWFGQDFGPNP